MTRTKTRALANWPNNAVSVLDFGAMGDGVTDDTAAIQLALDTVSAAGGGTVFVPSGTYIINGADGNGGFDLRTKVAFVGAGPEKTILKNAYQTWKKVVGVRGGEHITISDMTIDGGWISNTQGYQPPVLDVSTIRGEGIIFYNSSTPATNFTANNLKILNTGHYGIGLQNVPIKGARLTNLFFANIGGDCIDIKETTGYPKQGIVIDGFTVLDGCGHNTPTDGTEQTGHINQACIDVGGQCTLSNISIYGLDSYDGTLGANGVRFRAPVVDKNRAGSAGSVATNIYVESSKGSGEGEGGIKRITGLMVNDENISITNVTVKKCYWGVRIQDSGDGVPHNVSISGISVSECSGANPGPGEEDTTYGISTTNATRNIFLSGVIANNKQGVNFGGTNNNINLVLDGNEIGIKGELSKTSNYDLTLDNNTLNASPAIDYITEGSNLIRHSPDSVALSLYSTRNDNSWSSSTPLGLIDVHSYDTTGSGRGSRGTLGLYPTGGSNASNVWRFSVNGSTDSKFYVSENVSGSTVPLTLPFYNIVDLPTPSNTYKSTIVFVNDDVDGFVLAYCDGNNWRRTYDRVIVST